MEDRFLIGNRMTFEKNKDSLDANLEKVQKDYKKEVSFQELLDTEMDKLKNKEDR